VQNYEFRELALNEPNPFHYATLNFQRQSLVPAPSRASSTTTKRSPIALRTPIPAYLRLQGSIAWAPVQGARRATELDARLDTSLGAILDFVLDVGHSVIFGAILDAVFNPGLVDVKLNCVLKLIMGKYRYCEGVKMPLKKPAYSRD